jgi:GNAT superfamily N-acetyltransferase
MGYSRPVMSTDATFAIRLALERDIPALSSLMESAIAELLGPFLTAEQLRASFEIMGIDTQLIADGTYFVAEREGLIAGCGGWSPRATHFGGDHSAGRDERLLDIETEPARIRAMYTHPSFARRGVGRILLAVCERHARLAGFISAELVATTAGELLYRAQGYQEFERFYEITPRGIGVPLIRMRKRL